MDTDEQNTRYVKGSQRSTPKKADHEHEYIQVVTWQYIRYGDGTVSERKHRFSLPPECVVCGATKRLSRRLACVEVEVTWAEFNTIKRALP